MAKLLTGTRVYGTANVDSVLRVGNTTPVNSTSNTTGSLIVTGGVGVSGNLYSGNIVITGTTSNGITFADGTRQITAGGGAASNSFGKIFVSGRPLVIANTADTTVTFVAGSGMTITTSGTANTITFAASGGGGSISITDDTSNTGTYYPLLGTVTTGTLSTANTSSTKLYYQPSTGILNATTFNSLSDESRKTDINIIPNSLNIVENLNGVTFKWIENGLPSAGLIAQDVEKYLPQLISDGENGKTLNYDGVIGVLVEAIKELSQRVKYLEGK